MPKITSIASSERFKSSEERILELKSQISACQNRLSQLQEQAINVKNSTERGSIRNQEAYFRNTVDDLTKELTRLQIL